MDVAQTTTTALSAASGATTTKTPNAKAVLSSDFETFLKMLTVQMENQDPLNPVESTEFATQLATFSGVEQQVQTNDLLKSLGAQLGAMNVSQLSGWVGMKARADMPVNFSENPVRIVTEASPLASSAKLVVKNSAGTEMARYDIATARTELDWNGRNNAGLKLPSGQYRLSVESFSNGELITTSPVLVESRIIEARNENGVPKLVMETGQTVDTSKIKGLRNP